MINQIIVVGLGGALGSILRYLTQLLFNNIFTSAFPFGTFIANITGCFAIGVLYALFEKHLNISAEVRLFWITGICGGYTTFSSFSNESILLMKQGNYTVFFLYLIGSVALGLAATLLGILVAK